MVQLTDETAPLPAKRKTGKLLLLVAVPLLLVGSGAGAAVYGVQAGWFSVAPGHADEGSDKPRLVPKSEQKRASLSGDGADKGHGEAKSAETGHGKPMPAGEGGDQYASNYYPLEKEFTANLRDSVHFIQVGIAVSTPYDERVLENIKTHEIAIRSQVLMALGETEEEEVFSLDGKKRIQDRLVKAVNAVLKEKEGFGGVSNVYFTNFIVQ
jgi:flagellar protein FliL